MSDDISEIEAGLQLLQTIFVESDVVLFRPIETWTEGGRKRSQVDYKNTCYRRAMSSSLRYTLSNLLQLSATNRLNVFFGICPRFNGRGAFDLAWQIRIVRVLWTDIDHITVDEALGRITKASLPQPSAVVNSGHGAHVYWVLEAPYLIDDVGDPPGVHTAFVVIPGGRKQPQKYIVEDGEKTYVDNRPHTGRLSRKAQHVQDVLAGIADACGGDHTTDLSRLLRVPGTLNRKDERNGRAPVPTSLVECDGSRRYAFETFERFAKPSAASERLAKITSMALPVVRKPSASKADKLAEHVAACSIAPAGARSETDFSLCCFAIRNGIDRDLVWGQVEQVGKFAERGQRYFDVTWENAEFDVRAGTYEKVAARVAAVSPVPPPDTENDSNLLSLHDTGMDDGPDQREIIRIEAATTPVGDTLRQITNCLFDAGDCFVRCDQLVVVHGDAIATVLSPPELGGLLNQHVEFFYVDDKDGEYRSLSTAYAQTWLHNRVERARLREIRLFSRNPVYTSDWRLVAPGLDRESGIYYAGPEISPRDGTRHLDTLLQDFCFKSPADRTNFLGMLLTIVLISRFIGAKPGALFNGNQPGLGKSMLGQIIAILRDGRPTESASYNPNDEELEKRLGAIVRRGVMTIIIDNAKGHGRRVLIESPCLERCMTDAVLSFRLLGKSDEIRAENSHIFVITANSPDVSPDLISRSVVINLEYEGDPKRRHFQVADPEDYAQRHRSELLGELLGMVERWKAGGSPLANVCSRFNKRGWGEIVGGILEFNGEPDFLANAEHSAAQLDETRREFEDLVSRMVDEARGNWTATELVDYCARNGLLAAELGEGSERSKATRMGTIAGRFIDETFELSDGSEIRFIRSKERKGNLYRVTILEVPNLSGFAEPLPDLDLDQGSAP